MAQDLGSLASVITDLAFAPCASGNRTFSQITIKMDHIAAGSLSAAFTSNLSSSAVTVLNASTFTWPMVQDTWSKLGLTNSFAYNGTDNLVIEVEVTGGGGAPGACHRDTRQRVYSRTVGAANGSNSNAALKMELSTGSGASVFGKGCMGSNGEPAMGFTGEPRLTKTLTVGLSNGPILAPVMLNLGLTNKAPFPVDLSIVGAPGCFLYTDGVSGIVTASDAAGSASKVLPVPNDPNLVGLLFYLQWVCIDPGANPANQTTSSAGSVLVGT